QHAAKSKPSVRTNVIGDLSEWRASRLERRDSRRFKRDRPQVLWTSSKCYPAALPFAETPDERPRSRSPSRFDRWHGGSRRTRHDTPASRIPERNRALETRA